MVNTTKSHETELGLVTRLVTLYVGIVVATIVTLVLMSAMAPELATDEAWGHAIVVAAFAVVLPLRLRAALRGNRRARTAVGIIAAVLVIVNLAEAAVPGFLPGWMRIEMVVIAALMAGTAFLVLRKHQ